jgi:hypothetical protein
MIQPFVDKFMSQEESIRGVLKHLSVSFQYRDLVELVIRSIGYEDEYTQVPDPERITEIDHGDYQGTLVFVIAEDGYQPSTYWYVRIHYGSCSGCDTLQAAQDYDWDENVHTDAAVDDYWTLCLHIVQRLKQMDKGSV